MSSGKFEVQNVLGLSGLSWPVQGKREGDIFYSNFTIVMLPDLAQKTGSDSDIIS